jgi:TonB family protein
MRRWLALTFQALFLSALLVSNAPKSFAQQNQSESKRKMTTRVTPNYPGIARTMNISGTVKVEAVVAPDGTVKSAVVTGGHPLLGQAAVDAVRQSKWEPAKSETHELVTICFRPAEAQASF